MAGKNQHFVPQFLQRGFAITTATGKGFGNSKKKARKGASVWVFDKNQNSYRTSTRNKGAERFFYGLENSTVDSTITAAEIRYANIVNKLRLSTASTAITSDITLIAELVSHLYVRTKHARDSGEEAYRILLEMLRNLFVNESSYESFLKNAIQKNSDLLKNNFEQRFRELSLQQKSKILSQLKENPDLISDQISKLGLSNPLTESFFQGLKETSSETSKEAHINALSQSIAPAARTEQLRRLHWFVHVDEENSFILGDVVVFCLTADGEYKPIMNMVKDMHCIFLPLSSRHILIGTTSDSIPIINVEILNEASAGISREFFIASQQTNREECYCSLIDTNSSITSESELQEIMKVTQEEWFA